MRLKRRPTNLFTATALLSALCACSLFPMAESPLEGTWELIPDSPPELLTGCLLTIDGNGDVTQVSYTFLDRATLTWNNPTAEVTVEDNQLQINVMQGAMGSAQGFTFNGTLDSTSSPTRAPGTLSLNLDLGDVGISVIQGEATLVKQ